MSADDPACWSWPIPGPTLDVADLQRLRDSRRWKLSLNAVTWHDDPAVYRFREFHAGRCAICGRYAGGTPWWARDNQRYVEDHCHVTGQVRGLLCHVCNLQEGRSHAPRFERYRTTHPAVLLDHYQLSDGCGWRNGWPPGTPRRIAATPRPLTRWGT